MDTIATYTLIVMFTLMPFLGVICVTIENKLNSDIPKVLPETRE